MKPYRPSNGTEGMWFDEEFCNRCINMNPNPDLKPQCHIAACAYCYGLDDPEYPKEWVYENDQPTCTAFKLWDWENNGDPNDPDNPNYIQPIDPNQITLF